LTGNAGECVSFAIDWRPHLVGGTYYLNVGCYRFDESEKIFLDVRRSFVKVRVRPTISDIGFADLEGGWTIMETPRLDLQT
jgi:hypothetical protein